MNISITKYIYVTYLRANKFDILYSVKSRRSIVYSKDKSTSVQKCFMACDWSGYLNY